jgi:hypothetical protein
MSIKHTSLATRSIIADTLALFVFFTVTGVVNERYIVGLTWEQVFNARLLGTVIMVPIGRPYGIWRDWVMQRASDKRFSYSLWDSIALLTFQTPVYAIIIFFSGASGAGFALGVIGAAIMMLALGRPYGAFLNFIRSLFNLTDASLGHKPQDSNAASASINR